MQLKIQNKHPLIDKLDDLEIGFDPRPLTKKEQKLISAFIKKDKNTKRKNNTNA
jgi:hypothetical protein